MNKPSIITTSWDDGHIQDLRLADLLRKYSIPATFYISPLNREWDKKDLLADKEVTVLSKDFEIGAHTMTHPELTAVPLNEAKEEIQTSKTYLEDLLSKEVSMFCYPRGLFNPPIKNLVKEAGFKGARTIQPFRTSIPNDVFEMGTTHHSVKRSIKDNLLLSLKHTPSFIPLILTTDWVKMGKKMLDSIERHGGIWHFWGHSWQIDQNNWWYELEELLAYASAKPNFNKCTNYQVIETAEKTLAL